MSVYLPSTDDGYLPYWLLLVSATAALNCVQAYATTSYTARVYISSQPPVTPLSSRTFGTWSLLAAIVRAYAAYNISDPIVYQLALWTYAVAFGHFASEWFYFGTARWGEGLAGPIFVSTGSLAWMFWQWGWYVS